MPSMKRSPGTTNAALGELLRRVFYFLDHAAPFPGNGHGLMQLEQKLGSAIWMGR